MKNSIAGGDLDSRNVAENAAKTNGHQQQRFEASVDGEVEEQKADGHHHQLSEGELVETRGLP